MGSRYYFKGLGDEALRRTKVLTRPSRAASFRLWNVGPQMAGLPNAVQATASGPSPPLKSDTSSLGTAFATQNPRIPCGRSTGGHHLTRLRFWPRSTSSPRSCPCQQVGPTTTMGGPHHFAASIGRAVPRVPARKQYHSAAMLPSLQRRFKMFEPTFRERIERESLEITKI